MFFSMIVEKKLSVTVTIANVVKDTTANLLLEDLFVRNKENGILDVNNGKLLRLLQEYSIQNTGSSFFSFSLVGSMCLFSPYSETYLQV